MHTAYIIWSIAMANSSIQYYYLKRIGLAYFAQRIQNFTNSASYYVIKVFINKNKIMNIYEIIAVFNNRVLLPSCFVDVYDMLQVVSGSV